jgi:hypothetical protein
MAEKDVSQYNAKELRQLARAFSLMGDDAVEEAKKAAAGFAEFAIKEIREAGYERTKAAKAVRAVVDGAKVAVSSKTGRIDIGFARQRLSGGGNTQQLWPGLEFGSNRYKQFPSWSGRYGAGSRGWFIYPTLRKIQPELTERWERTADEIVKKWAN